MALRSKVLESKYLFEYDVGLWTFGTVQVLKERNTQSLVTCKTVAKTAVRNQDNVLEKLLQLKKLEHGNICSVVDVLEDQSNFYILSEKLPGNDVADWVVRVQEEGCWLQEQTIASYIRQTLIAVAHAHANRTVHCDLRASSLALTSKLPDASVKVCDLGVASVVDPEGFALRRSPGPYTAPELMRGVGHLMGAAADVWSVGAIAHAMLVGQPPEQDKENSSWGVQKLLSKRDSDSWADRSSLSHSFVNQLLQQAERRPTAARALQHPWLKGAVSLDPDELTQGSEVQQRLICFMLALIMIPDVMEYREIYKIRELFTKTDTDTDGLVGTACAGRILRDMNITVDAAVQALQVCDVRSTGTFDLAAASCACFLASELMQDGLCKMSELLNRLCTRFFQIFGKSPNLQSVTSKIQEAKQAAITRDLEVHAHLDYEEILEQLPEDDIIDRNALLRSLGNCAGAGTPLYLDVDEDGHESDGSWTDRLGLPGLHTLACTMLGSCGMMEGDRRYQRITAVW